MKTLLLSFAFLLHVILLTAQSIGINNSAPDNSAVLDIKSGTKGLLLPRTSSASRLAIVSPAKGLVLFDTTVSSFYFYSGSAWIQLSSSINTWSTAGNTATNPAINFIGTTDMQSLRFRVNNSWAGELNPTNQNVFLGIGAGQSTTSGVGNVGVGEHSLQANSTGSFNVTTGYNALVLNSTGSRNTAIGYKTLSSDISGNDNTAIGYQTLFFNTGSENTAAGASALYNNTGGSGNTAFGYLSLVTNNTGNYNTANGVEALASNTFGNSNTANGYTTLISNTSGSSNTASGSGAMTFNATGNWNTATGAKTLYSNSNGSGNTTNGYQAAYWNTTGFNLTAVGYNVLYSNTDGNSNTGNGFQALYSNTTGGGNTSIGYNSLYASTAADFNTATGAYALTSNISGIDNTATGVAALQNNISGIGNTASGYQALSSSTTGHNNTAVGFNTLLYNTGGNNNIAVGYYCGNNSGAPNVNNSIGIGNDGSFLNGTSNQVIIGNSSTVYIGGKVNWGVVSDERIKSNIKENVKGLDFIERLRPVTYNIKNEAINKVTGAKDSSRFPEKYDGEKITYTGFLAQEVEQAAIVAGYNFSGYTKPATPNQLYTIRYGEFVVPLVKAVQEQQAIISNQDIKIALLEKRLAALEGKQ